MCRHLAYLGRPRSIAELMLEPEFGLLRQSYAPRDMRGGGTVNADGFGVGWYPPGAESGPARYRHDQPLWTDSSFRALAAATESGAVLAAVRSATVGMPVVSTACAPFTDGHWLFSHNGMVTGWPHSIAELAGQLPVTDLVTLDAPTDSALLWALARDRLARGLSPERVLAGLVTEVAETARGSRLNLLLTDGVRIYATAWSHALSYRATAGSLVIASEPYDELPGWVPVPDGHLVVGGEGEAHSMPISGAAGPGPAHEHLDAIADSRGA
ncbi:MAG TPA: ergothioneine biosynthesis protein EgtC [Pseudonocardia sp.]|uniref:ergothioneine biosynthesis protein EgtC n=1 Tax=Pseudonocardia sp. TaxID=60912 RepID=UPI002F404572